MADAKKTLSAALEQPNILSTRVFVRDDLVAMRRQFAEDDDGFESALEQTAREISQAVRIPSYGIALERDLEGWRKSLYSSSKNGSADMRLIFRFVPPHSIEILTFVLRRSIGADGLHSSAYKTASARNSAK